MELDKLFENPDCEKALIKIADGDHEALSVIHKYMNRQIYAVAYAVLRDVTLSDDVVQETYIKIMDGKKLIFLFKIKRPKLLQV